MAPSTTSTRSEEVSVSAAVPAGSQSHWPGISYRFIQLSEQAVPMGSSSI